MHRFLVICFMAVLLPFCARAQESKSLEPWLDLIRDDPTLAELLQDLLENPIALNTATKADLASIPLLSETAVEQILKKRKQKGAFKSIRQIKPIVGSDIYLRIRPFLILNPVARYHFYWQQRNYRTIENVPEIQKGTFKGTNFYNYTKTRVKYSPKWDAGLIAQKDVGEVSFADYANGYLQFNSAKVRLIAGSFYLQLGQGLVFSSPFGQMKSSLVILPFNARKDRAAPYLGTAENMAQTGLYGKFQITSKLKIRLLLSRTLRDAQFNPITGKIIGFDYTGYHRSTQEANKKDLILEQMQALNVSFVFPFKGRIGLTASRFTFTPSIDFTKGNVTFSELRRRFYHFKGQAINLGSLYYGFEKGALTAAGEWAISGLRHWAASNSVFVRAADTKVGVLLWRINRNFQTPLGRVFDDHSPFPSAQQGIYAAFAHDFTRGSIQFYKLIKKDLWRTYFEPMPGLSDEWLLQNRFDLHQVTFVVRIRRRVQEGIARADALGLNRLGTSLRVELLYGRFRRMGFKTRLEWKRVEPADAKGFSMFQDVRWSWSKNLIGNFRISFFRTSSYVSRIYEYENDVPGSFANIGLYGQGFKWYVQFNWRINANFHLWLKYRYIHLNKRDFNTLDYGRIARPLQRLLRLQFEIRF